MVIDSSTHPLAPPTPEETLVQWLRLIRSRRVGAATFYRLMAEHGDAEAALAALSEIARDAGVRDYAPCPLADAQRELDAGRAVGAQLIARGMPAYPAALDDLPDAPPLLWIKGSAPLVQRPAVALVGARNASSLGTRMARKLSAELGDAGYVTVSGLARGIDTAVHDATLATGTIAVLGGGIDVIYPRENANLAARIAETGLLVSEMPPGLQPQARHFPRRNRIISGLSSAVVVVEAAARSGSLITAREALDQGRDVLAVPGHPFDARASGCNMLIRDGAGLVRGARDVLEVLPQIATPAAERPASPTPPADPAHGGIPTDLCHRILDRLGPAPLAEDQLIRDLNLPAQTVSAELVTLELDGRITRQPGGLLARAV